MFKLKDARGKESITLAFVVIAFVVVLFKFTLAGLTLPVLGPLPPMSGGEFAAAVGSVLAIWTAREWKEKSGVVPE